MSTTIRPEISEKNPYWIDRHRYYELKHFCLQYPLWKEAKKYLSDYSTTSLYLKSSKTGKINDPIKDYIERASYYSDRIDMVENAAKNASKDFGNYILKAVTEGYSYNYLKTVMNIPCCKEIYYENYRKFFWLLSNSRE